MGEGSWAPGERAEIARVICMSAATCVLAALHAIPPETVLIALGVPAVPGLVGMVKRRKGAAEASDPGEKPP